MTPLPTYTPDALRAVLARHSLTGSRAGRLLGVNSRTIRKWTAPNEIANHHDMPDSAWWLLLIVCGELTAADLLEHLTGEPD
jgi:hypothetical protein